MVQRTKVTLIDDLDEEVEAVETVRFGLDEVSYEIDLSDEHAVQLRTVLGYYAGAGRRVGGGGGTRGPRRKEHPRPEPVATPGDIRTWARNHGLFVSARGRISSKVRKAFDAAKQRP